MNIKWITVVLFFLLFFSLSAAAEDSDLHIRVEAMKERQSTYTSVTDLYGLDILTPDSAEREAAYASWLELKREQELGGLFFRAIQPLDDERRILERAQALGLFLRDQDETYFRSVQPTEDEAISPIFAVGLTALLCVYGFLFSNSRYKRKKRRQAADVHHRDPARA